MTSHKLSGFFIAKVSIYQRISIRHIEPIAINGHDYFEKATRHNTKILIFV